MSKFFTICSTRMMGLVGMAAMILGLAAPTLADSPAGKPDQQLVEILAQIAILNDKVDALSGPGRTGPCEVLPVWGRKFPGADRFVAVLDGAAYCDQETGLVWEGSPDPGAQTWTDAITHCAQREVGGRKGWTLPMREQLATLVDTNTNNPVLSQDHPFQNVQSANYSYWSATTWTVDPTLAWLVGFSSGIVDVGDKAFHHHSWCVRGGQSFDGNMHDTRH
jgi:hypothetical protein